MLTRYTDFAKATDPTIKSPEQFPCKERAIIDLVVTVVTRDPKSKRVTRIIAKLLISAVLE